MGHHNRFWRYRNIDGESSPEAPSLVCPFVDSEFVSFPWNARKYIQAISNPCLSPQRSMDVVSHEKQVDEAL